MLLSSPTATNEYPTGVQALALVQLGRIRPSGQPHGPSHYTGSTSTSEQNGSLDQTSDLTCRTLVCRNRASHEAGSGPPVKFRDRDLRWDFHSWLVEG